MKSHNLHSLVGHSVDEALQGGPVPRLITFRLANGLQVVVTELETSFLQLPIELECQGRGRGRGRGRR